METEFGYMFHIKCRTIKRVYVFFIRRYRLRNCGRDLGPPLNNASIENKVGAMKLNSTMSTHNVVLFIATHPSAPGEYIRIAKQLIKLGYAAAICLATPRAIGNVHADQRDSVQYLTLNGGPINWSLSEASIDSKKHKQNNTIRRLIRSCSRLTIFRGLLNSVRLFRSLVIERSEVLLLLKRIQPNIVIVPGDRQPRLEATIAELCHQYGVTLICAPTCQIAAPATLALRRPAVPVDCIMRYFIPAYWQSKIFPSQTYVSNEKTVNFYSLATALLLTIFGVMPRNPWQMGGGGRAACLFVHGDADKDLQIAAGLPAHQVFVLGQPSTDLLYDQLVKKPRRTLNSNIVSKRFLNDLPTAVFAVPQPFSDAPNWTQNSLLSVRDSLIAAGYNVILSIHPKQHVDNYRFLELESHAYLANTPLVTFLGYSDLYISSYSSTVRWAMLLGLPLAVVDYHNENSPIFDDLPIVPILNSDFALKNWLLEMKNTASRSKLGEQFRAVSSYYQYFDGHSTERVVMKIIDISQSKRL